MNLKRNGSVRSGCRLSNTQKSVPASKKTRCFWFIKNAVDSINSLHYFVSAHELFARRDKIFNKQRFIVYILEILKHFSIYNVWCYLFRTLSMPFNNFSSVVVKWRRSLKCRKKLAMGTTGGGGHIPTRLMFVLEYYWWPQPGPPRAGLGPDKKKISGRPASRLQILTLNRKDWPSAAVSWALIEWVS